MKRYFVYSFIAICLIQLCACSDDDEPSGGGMIGGHEYVDLGLPSRTLWAACNVGASRPEQFGNFFAWGDTLSLYGGRTLFDWDNYKWYSKSTGLVTKYCIDKKDGVVDSLAELQAEDDMATACWGKDWQTPTVAQYRELINSDYTTTEWTELNGVVGRRITGRNGRSIFLPAAGFCDASFHYSVGVDGFYWTRSIYPTNSYRAYNLCFFQTYACLSYGDRFYGQSVRPVRKK